MGIRSEGSFEGDSVGLIVKSERAQSKESAGAVGGLVERVLDEEIEDSNIPKSMLMLVVMGEDD